jgi:putative ABC transport system permease protein
VASLALGVALTVMVASFRDGVARWLDSVLPADLYARSAGTSAAGEVAWLPADFARRPAALPGVARVQASRVRSLQLAPGQPAVALVARPLGADGAELPLREPALPADPVRPGVFVSEAMVALYGARPGTTLALPLGTSTVEVRVRGVWRDFARQFGCA